MLSSALGDVKVFPESHKGSDESSFYALPCDNQMQNQHALVVRILKLLADIVELLFVNWIAALCFYLSVANSLVRRCLVFL